MSKQLKVGDRVRIHGLEDDGDIYSTTVGTYIECPELDGMTGTIIEANKDGYIVREDSGYEEDFIGACLTLIERPRRTFEEIVKELGWWYSPWNKRAEKQYDEFSANIYSDGSLECVVEPSTCITRVEFPSSELAAISAACSEIAANYKAEHGKEGA